MQKKELQKKPRSELSEKPKNQLSVPSKLKLMQKIEQENRKD
jgi:hypothetical protein